MKREQIKTELLKRLSVIENAAVRAKSKIENNEVNIDYELREIKQYYQSSNEDWEALFWEAK